MTLAASKPIPTPQAKTQLALAGLQSLVKDDLTRVDEVILSNVQTDVPLIAHIAHHIIASGGKRLRPALTLIAARLCGYEGMRHVKLAACVEFIHTATLLHDDVVDESKLRRGSPTANEVWGNQASVLVGDFLLGRAFQLMVSDGSLKVLKILSDTSAIIAKGEVKQLTTTNNLETTEQDYLDVISAKTAALFSAACEIGPVVSGMEHQEENMRKFGLCLGIAFQLVDDALDYSAEQEALGKTVGDDFREGKVTLPVILAYQQGDEEERSFWKRTMEDQDYQEGDLAHAISLLQKHGALDAAIERAAYYAEEAKIQLSGFADTPEKFALMETVDFAVNRSY